MTLKEALGSAIVFALTFYTIGFIFKLVGFILKVVYSSSLS
jgi:hypothetical protein